MGVQNAPQWLLPSFVRSVIGAGATASPDDIRVVGERLIERWSGPGRHFHNLKHLINVLAHVDELAEETHEPELVRLAAWYHGAIFDAADRASYANRGGEDEVASAALARAELESLGVPQRAMDRVHGLVIALARHGLVPGDFDCAVLCDADLAMLAAEPQRYKAYLNEVREEYAHLPVEDYVRARLRILHKLLSRKVLFASPLGTAWEAPARQNIEAELQRLEKELHAIEAAGAAAAAAAPADATGATSADPTTGQPRQS
jgi:predicted metal-dependent HD superfamily phosphohydrolase